jgi:hypothetical protein
VYIIKFDLEHEIEGVRIADNFRGEFYNLISRRERFGRTGAATLSGATGAREMDKQDNFLAAN